MAYSTTVKFRLMTNFTDVEINDTDLGNMIADADRAIVRLTTTEVYLERLEGSVDGSNVDFRTKYKPIADSDASGSVDGSDVTVYYATYDDTTNWIELGSAKTVSSVQAETGILTMSTAPTTTTAEAGILGVYRYDSAGVQSNDIRILAATYYLAYMVANKVQGKTPDYSTTGVKAPYIRKEKTGADWLALCYETLGLQDKIFLVRPDGEGIPKMSQGTESKIKDI